MTTEGPRSPRPPVPLWLGLLFGFGPAVVSVVLLWLRLPSGADEALGAILSISFFLVCGIPMLGGLAIAARFFTGLIARFFGGIAFALLILIMIWSAVYVGCKCNDAVGRYKHEQAI